MRELVIEDFEAIKAFLKTSKDNNIINNVIKRSKVVLIEEESFLR